MSPTERQKLRVAWDLRLSPQHLNGVFWQSRQESLRKLETQLFLIETVMLVAFLGAFIPPKLGWWAALKICSLAIVVHAFQGAGLVNVKLYNRHRIAFVAAVRVGKCLVAAQTTSDLSLHNEALTSGHPATNLLLRIFFFSHGHHTPLEVLSWQVPFWLQFALLALKSALMLSTPGQRGLLRFYSMESEWKAAAKRLYASLQAFSGFVTGPGCTVWQPGVHLEPTGIQGATAAASLLQLTESRDDAVIGQSMAACGGCTVFCLSVVVHLCIIAGCCYVAYMVEFISLRHWLQQCIAEKQAAAVAAAGGMPQQQQQQQQELPPGQNERNASSASSTSSSAVSLRDYSIEELRAVHNTPAAALMLDGSSGWLIAAVLHLQLLGFLFQAMWFVGNRFVLVVFPIIASPGTMNVYCPRG